MYNYKGPFQEQVNKIQSQPVYKLRTSNATFKVIYIKLNMHKKWMKSLRPFSLKWLQKVVSTSQIRSCYIAWWEIEITFKYLKKHTKTSTSKIINTDALNISMHTLTIQLKISVALVVCVRNILLSACSSKICLRQNVIVSPKNGVNWIVISRRVSRTLASYIGLSL